MTEAVKASANGLHPMPRAKPGRKHDSLTQAVQSRAKKKRKPPATRVGRKGILIYVEPEVAVAIRRLAAAFENGTVQALGEHAFRLLFAKYHETWPGSEG